MHRYRARRHEESNGDGPLAPDDAFERQLSTDDPFVHQRLFGVLVGDVVVASFGASWVSRASPDYAGRRHLLLVNGYVLRPYRRRGFARLWLPSLLDLVSESGTTTLSCMADDEDGHAFLHRLGADLKTSSTENRLDLAHVDWRMLDGWIEEARRRSPESRLERYERRLPERLWDEMSRVYTAVANDQPFDDADMGEFRITAETLRERDAQQRASGAEVHTFLIRERDGAISAYTSLRRTSPQARVLLQVGTGTVAAYRRRGLAKWLKAESLRAIRDSYADVTGIVTHMARSNAAMKTINDTIGFRIARHIGAYQMVAPTLARAIAAE